MNLSTKQNRVTEVENKLMVTRGEGGSDKLENWDLHVHTTIYKITNKDLLYSSGNSTQYSVMAYMGKESKREWIYI